MGAAPQGIAPALFWLRFRKFRAASSFFATLECELLDRRRFATVTEARREVFGFIEGFYNTRRLHSALGYASPTNFEKLNHAA